MRGVALLAGLTCISSLTTGCGIQRYLPGKAVLDARALAAWPAPTAAPVTYDGPARVAMPVLPVQIFGLYYDLDVVLVSDHPSWDMHEYARVDLPDGPLWLAKDARPNGVQGIVADVPELQTWAPEAAVPRQRGAVRVEDRGEGALGERSRVDLRIAYDNLDGEAVEVEVAGRLRSRPPGKRNGSTMGHSRQSAAVVLDLERFGAAGRVRMRIGGERARVKKLLGIYPMKFLLQQAQAGIMVASQRQAPSEGGFTLTRPGPGAIDPATGQPGWPTLGTEAWTLSAGTEVNGRESVVAERVGPVITLRYHFIDGGLVRAEAWQVGREGPVTVLRLSPALPDLSRPFAGTAHSRFALAVNGQEGHGVGTLSATWPDADTVALALRPEAPWWLADRPMDGTLRYDDEGGVSLTMGRVAAQDQAGGDHSPVQGPPMSVQPNSR